MACLELLKKNFQFHDKVKVTLFKLGKPWISKIYNEPYRDSIHDFDLHIGENQILVQYHQIKKHSKF